MDTKKEIYFFVGDMERELEYNPEFYCADTYASMEWALRNKMDKIVTTSMAHFSFDRMLIDGYDIYLCYKSNKLKVEPHMEWLGQKDLRPAHNILKIFLAGCFDEDICFKRDKIYHDD